MELVAAFREPLFSLVIERLHRLGIADRVEAVHGRVDYDFEAFKGRLAHFPGLKKLEITAYDALMPLVGETYRATKKLPRAKLLLHAPTLFQLASQKGNKPRLVGSRLIIENDEKLTPAPAMQKWGDPLSPVDVYRFAQVRGLAKMVFDTAHFWRVYRDKFQRQALWQEFKQVANENVPIYWHLNRADDGWFTIKRSGEGFEGEHDAWLAEVCKLICARMSTISDQVCIEEPRQILLRLSRGQMEERREGIRRVIECLGEYKVLPVE